MDLYHFSFETASDFSLKDARLGTRYFMSRVDPPGACLPVPNLGIPTELMRFLF